MNITRTERRTVTEQVPDTIIEATSVPSWLGESIRQNCDCCLYPLNGEPMTACGA